MKRSEAREYAFKLIYEAGVQEDKELSLLLADTEAEQGFKADKYIRETLSGVVEHRAELDEIIAENSHGWKLSRISKTSGAILRLALYEMLYGGLPLGIAINEAVELAKKYDHEKAPGFINGILNSAAERKGLKKPADGAEKPEADEKETDGDEE